MDTFLRPRLCVPKIWHVRRHGSRSDASRGRAICCRCRRSECRDQFRNSVTVLADYDPTLIKIVAVAAAAVPAALVAWFVLTRVLHIGAPRLNPAVTSMTRSVATAALSAPRRKLRSGRGGPELGAMGLASTAGPTRTFRQVRPAKSIVQPQPHLVRVRDFERSRRDVEILGFHAQGLSKPDLDAPAECGPDPPLGAVAIDLAGAPAIMSRVPHGAPATLARCNSFPMIAAPPVK